MEFGVARPADGTLVVIVAEDSDGKLVILPDEDHQDEAAVYLDGDPEIAAVLEAARKVHGPSARAVSVTEFKKLAGGVVASVATGAE
jgi:hypothetical protein